MRRVWIGIACVGLLYGAGIPSGLTQVVQLVDTQHLLDPAVRTLHGTVITWREHLLKQQPESEATPTAAPTSTPGSLALLEDRTRLLYLFIAEDPSIDPNELVAEHLGASVLLTGKVYQRGGLRGIAVTAVEPAPSSERTEQTAQ